MSVLMLSYFIRNMDPNSSLGKICLGEDIVVISSDKVEGSGDWNSPKFQDTANSGQKKETKAMVFHQMETEEVNDRFVAPCFVNGLEAYDGEINLGVFKKELIVALRGEIYFVKFIINLEEDDVEPRVIFSRSFLRMTKAITDFGAGTIIIYPDIDPFMKETKEQEKSNDDWDNLLDFNLDDVPLLGTSSSAGGHLTQEEAAKEELAIRMSRKFALQEEERPIIEIMAYHDKYKKILDEVWKDKNSLEFQDTTNSGQKKETKAMVFYQMDTKEVNDRFVAPCFVNGLEAYDGEINLVVEENMISNEYVVKLCLEHEVRRGNKVVKKELIVALRETKEEEKSNDDWDHLLDFNIDDIPLLGEEGLPPFVCKMGKSSRNKKRAMENLNFFYQDIRTSSSVGGHLTQEEATKEALAIRMSRKFALLEEERPIIETMAYHDKYKKILDEVNENALADTGSDINTMPYRIYEQLGREDMKKVDRGIIMINHTQAEAMGILTNVLCHVGVTTLITKFLILDILIDCDAPIVVGRGFLRTIGGIVNTQKRLFSTFDGLCHQTFCAARFDVMRNAESDSDDEEEYQIKRNKFGALIYGPKPAP
ncbi:putative reverse transcriptase domain-containing protein [Tanacetum coccineum]